MWWSTWTCRSTPPHTCTASAAPAGSARTGSRPRSSQKRSFPGFATTFAKPTAVRSASFCASWSTRGAEPPFYEVRRRGNVCCTTDSRRLVQVEPLPPIVYEEDYARPQPEYVIESKVAVRGTVTPSVEEPTHLPPTSQSPNPPFGGASRQSVSFEKPASTAQQASNNGMSESPQQDGGSLDAECAKPAEPSSEISRVVEYSATRVHTANGASGQIQAEGEMNAAIPAAPDGGRHAEGTRSLEEEMPSAAVAENAPLSSKEEVAQSGNGASQLSQEDLAARYPKLSPGKWWSGPFPSSENQQGLEAPTWVSEIQAEIAEGSADGEGELEKLHRM